jgi:hypothetical protein
MKAMYTTQNANPAYAKVKTRDLYMGRNYVTLFFNNAPKVLSYPILFPSPL